MSMVKTFRIHKEMGVPDKDVREWLNLCERQLGIITVTTTFIPGKPEKDIDDRLSVIVTKLDDLMPVGDEGDAR